MAKFKTLYLTVPSDSNIAVFEDNIITDTSVIEFYTDDDNIYPIALSQSGNTVNVTLSNHTSDVHCCLTVNNISEFETPLNASDIIYNDTSVYYELLEHRFEINQIGTAIGTLNTALNSKQDELIPGDNITIEDNVISASGGGISTWNDLGNVLVDIGTWVNIPDWLDSYNEICISAPYNYELGNIIVIRNNQGWCSTVYTAQNWHNSVVGQIDWQNGKITLIDSWSVGFSGARTFNIKAR